MNTGRSSKRTSMVLNITTIQAAGVMTARGGNPVAKLLREPSKQPDMKAPKMDVGQGLKKSSSPPKKGWPYAGSRGEDHPNFDPGVKGKTQKSRKWPY
jgi:hypothetical protein